MISKMTKTPYFDEYEAIKKAVTKKENKIEVINTIKDQILSIISHCNTEFIINNSQIDEIESYLEYLKRFNNISNYAIHLFNSGYITFRIQPTPSLSYIDLVYKII